jgi:hypothetical protein
VQITRLKQSVRKPERRACHPSQFKVGQGFHGQPRERPRLRKKGGVDRAPMQFLLQPDAVVNVKLEPDVGIPAFHLLD